MSFHDVFLVLAVVLIANFLQAIFAPRLGIDDRRLARLEKKVNLLLDHSGLEHDRVSDRVKVLAQQGKKIEAIKLFREETGAGLKEAKEAVEQMTGDLSIHV